jgi:hypothetical protein
VKSFFYSFHLILPSNPICFVFFFFVLDCGESVASFHQKIKATKERKEIKSEEEEVEEGSQTEEKEDAEGGKGEEKEEQFNG